MVTTSEVSGPSGPGNPWKMRIALVTLVHVVGTLHIVSIMAMAPVIQRDLDLSVTQFGLLITTYYGGQVVGSMPAGGMVDRLGVGWALVIAQVIMLAGTAIFIQATGFPLAAAATAVMGLGYSITNMGVKQTGVPGGGVLAAANGALVTVLSWQTILSMVIAVTVVSAVLCLRLTERPPGQPAMARRGALADFAQVLGDGNLGAIFGANAFFNMGQATFFGYLTLFMREAAHASQPVAGLCLGIAQAISAVGRIGWGAISDFLFTGRRKTLLVVMCGAAAVFLAAMAAVGPLWGVVMGAVLALLLGLTVASFAPLAQIMSAEAVEPRLAGAATGYGLVGTSVGGMVGPPLFGMVVDYTGDFANGWLVTAAVVLAGTILLGLGFKERR
jgi:predicted MFS family arabinose efflux permease